MSQEENHLTQRKVSYGKVQHVDPAIMAVNSLTTQEHHRVAWSSKALAWDQGLFILTSVVAYWFADVWMGRSSYWINSWKVHEDGVTMIMWVYDTNLSPIGKFWKMHYDAGFGLPMKKQSEASLLRYQPDDGSFIKIIIFWAWERGLRRKGR